MTDLLAQVEQAILRRELLSDGQSLVVGVSGGLDSMVLLQVLHLLSSRHGWHLGVAHFNHRLRGHSSNADERLVRQTARKLGLRVLVDSTDVRGAALSRKVSIEMAARRLRHEFLAQAAGSFGANTIALGHHADDQVELFLLRLLRGSGAVGLAGMKWRNPSPADRSLQIIRPLLEQNKRALLEFSREHRVRFREDASNADLDMQRNWVRHKLVPVLRRRYPAAMPRTLLRGMDVLGAESEFVGQAAERWLGARRLDPSRAPKRSHAQPSRVPEFDELPLAVQRRALHIQLLELGLTPDFELIESLRLYSERPIEVGQVTGAEQSDGKRGYRVTRLPDGLLALEPAQAPEFERGSRLVALHGPKGKVRFGALAITWRVESKKGSSLPPAVGDTEYFDAERVGSPICLRHWRPGDRFQPIGLAKPVKLQDLFTNLGIPRPRRHQLVVAATRQGELFWVENVRISEVFKLTGATTRRLHWAWQQL